MLAAVGFLTALTIWGKKLMQTSDETGHAEGETEVLLDGVLGNENILLRQHLID